MEGISISIDLLHLNSTLCLCAGIMTYEGTQALDYVKNFAEGSSQWDGFPITVDVPRSSILVGSKGPA